MIYEWVDDAGNVSRLFEARGEVFKVTNTGRRWHAAVRCDCDGKAHWHTVFTRRSERRLRKVLADTLVLVDIEAVQ